MTVLCVTEWVPQWVNNGHECIICEVSAINDPAPPHPSTPWNINDPHVAQHNVNLVANPMPQRQRLPFPILTPIAGVGLFHEASAKIIIRPAPEELFCPALEKFGLPTHRNVTRDSVFGLVGDYVAGCPLPEAKSLEDHLTLEHLPPNHQQAFHALIDLPDEVHESSAAIFLVEQLNDADEVAGGVVIIVFAGEIPKPVAKPAVKPTVTAAITASILYRPYSTNISTGFMTPDGFFLTIFGTQNINIETQNDGNQTLDGLSMYIEGVGDPNVTTPLTTSTPTNSQVLASASWKSIFSADFTNATPGETIVSFIIQQTSGSSTQSIRIVKKIFVLGIKFDPSSKTFTMTIPQGSLTFNIKTIIVPAETNCSCGPSGGGRKRCCCCGGSSGGTTSGTTSTIYPVLIQNGSATWTPSPSYGGAHGPLPFNDPFWKILFAAIALILAAIGSYFAAQAGGSGSTGPGGTAEETNPSVHCCTGVQAEAETDSETAAALFGAAAAMATIAMCSDEADLFWRGQTATPPASGLLTVSETVKFSADFPNSLIPGKAFTGDITWDYTRTLNDGSTLTHSATDPYENIHLLKAYDVYIDGTHNASAHYTHQRRTPLLIGAQFTKPDGTLFTGSQLYTFAVLWSDTGAKKAVELRDDGYTLAGDSGPPNAGNYVGEVSMIEAPTGNWYVFVFAQDVNTVLDGTDPFTAAQTIGGMLLTSQLVLNFDDKPCQLDYDAVVSVM